MAARTAALRRLLAYSREKPISLQAQAEITSLLAKETHRPDVSAIAENQDFQWYYGALLEAVESFAAANGDSKTWAVLAESAYNDFSDFAGWLSEQKSARPTLLRIAGEESADPSVRGNVLNVLARSCQADAADAPETKRALRAGLRNAKYEIVSSAVRGLRLCGDPSDLPQLRAIEKTATNKGFLRSLQETIAAIEKAYPGET